MTPSGGPTDGRSTDEAVRAGRAAAGPAAMGRLADQLHHAISEAFDDWNATQDAVPGDAPRATRSFARPVTAPPVRMEQMARTPEPTADLDDLVDLLVPRLVEKLVPALRDALRDD